MSDEQTTQGPLAQPAPTEARRSFTRRRILVGGAVAGSTLALTAVPTLGQETNTASSNGSGSASSSSTTTTTSPAPVPTAPAPTTTTSEPSHGDLRTPTNNRAFGTLLSESPDRKIMFPMLGRPNSSATWTDTYGACRSGCSRRHQGQDLLAPQMVKMVACVSGTVIELRHRSSGNSLYIRGDDGWFYCYLHINDKRPNTNTHDNRVDSAWGPKLLQFATGTHSMNEAAARGFRVQKGDFVAYNGDSGNAEGTNHLHFEIRKPASGSFSSETQRLWSSASVNPRESLRNAEPAREGPSVPATTFHPWNNARDLIDRQYTDLLQRTAAAANLTHWGEQLNSGQRSPQSMMAFFLESDECDRKAQSIARLYRAFFRRDPDHAGLVYWMDQVVKRGMTLNKVAENFVKVPEFVTMYGDLDDGEFVDLVYQNVLGRRADAAGKTYWLAEMARGVSRGRIMSHFGQAPENRAGQAAAMHVVTAYTLMFKRAPSADEKAAWVQVVSDTGSTEAMMNMLRYSAEYATVVKPNG